MTYDEIKPEIEATAELYLGSMVEFMSRIFGMAGGEELIKSLMFAADFVVALPGAGDGDKAIARGFATASARPNPDTSSNYTFDEANRLRELSRIISNTLPENYRKATQFNEGMLKAVLTLPFYLDSRIIILDFLGVSRSNAIVANAEIYKFHPEQALADPAGEGAWLK